MANDGSAQAQFYLGWIYFKKIEDKEINLVTAHMWLQLSALQEYPRATETLKLLEKQLSPAQIATGEALAAEWREKHSN